MSIGIERPVLTLVAMALKLQGLRVARALVGLKPNSSRGVHCWGAQHYI